MHDWTIINYSAVGSIFVLGGLKFRRANHSSTRGGLYSFQINRPIKTHAHLRAWVSFSLYFSMIRGEAMK